MPETHATDKSDMGDKGESDGQEVGDNTPVAAHLNILHEKIADLKKEKRKRKTVLTKNKNFLLRICSESPVDTDKARHEIDILWNWLESCLEIIDELAECYQKIGERESKMSLEKEGQEFEKEIVNSIQKAEELINGSLAAVSSPILQFDGPISPMSNNSSANSSSAKHLRPVEIPKFSGEKTMFSDFWSVFKTLVDESDEPAHIKMARLRQCLSGDALDAITGLGITPSEYEAAKEIIVGKYGGRRRQIQGYLDQLEGFKPLTNNDLNSLEKYSDLIRITVVKLEANDREAELGEGTLHSVLVKKLTDYQVQSYTRWLDENSKDRSVKNLSTWLKHEVFLRTEAKEMVHGVENIAISKVSYDKSRFSGRNSRVMFSEKTPEKKPCSYCNKAHGIWACEGYKGLSVNDRWQFAKDKKLCFRCLAGGHNGKACKRSRSCQVSGCSKSHHHLLHESSSSDVSAESPVYPGEGVNHRTHCSDHKGSESLSLRTIPVWVKANGKRVKVNALLDDASNETFLNEEVAGVLGIRQKFEPIRVHVLNDAVETFQSMPVSVELESVDGQFVQIIHAKTCPKKVTGNYRVTDWTVSKSKWPHLKEVSFPKPAHSGFIDLLIGSDNVDLHFSITDIKGTSPTSPVARLGPLGWTCIGSPSPETHRTMVSRTFFSKQFEVHSNTCCDVDKTLRMFWEVENYGLEKRSEQVLNADESKALKQVRDSCTYDSIQKKYTVATPWKGDVSVPDSFSMAKSRLESTERKLKGETSVRTLYEDTIKSYLDKGYIQKVELVDHNVKAWYLPHFPVIRMDKDTTKVRIVFDCSAKCYNTSLNDFILPGPKLQNDLVDVLIRFRRNPIALVCDIQEMYLQIQIPEKEWPMFRFLWRDMDSSRPVDIYEFKTVVFGKSSAPFEAQFVAQHNAKVHEHQFPMACSTVLHSTYMDDSMDSVKTVDKGVELYHQLSKLWEAAGMKARKWMSNSPAVMEEIPPAHRASQFTIQECGQVFSKTLGICWDCGNDSFSVSIPKFQQDELPTKRNVLRKVASIFDPLGFISPFVVRGKILLQKIWSRGYDWDDQIQDDMANTVENWCGQVSDLVNIRIPRCIVTSGEICSTELVTFVDASGDAYGAVIYCVSHYSDGTASSLLVASKAKVAPLCPVTIPRLELMAAVLGLRLTLNICPVLDMPIDKVHFYTDSTDVLWWIRGRGRDFRPFVANRVGEIQMSSDPAQWQHVPTRENPADICSRGASPIDLVQNELWKNGPEWLLKEKNYWPKLQQLQPKNLAETKSKCSFSYTFYGKALEQKQVLLYKSDRDSWRLDPHNFSSWTRLVKVHAWTKRFIHNARNPLQRISGMVLLPVELKDSEGEIISLAQAEEFSKEYNALVRNQVLGSKSSILNLNPRLDEQGVMRVGGRLQGAESLSYDTRYPIILPKSHWVTKLIVKYHHDLANHVGGVNFILSQLVSKYWVLSGREVIKQCETECNMCCRLKNKCASQVMAPLPSIRLRFTYRAFDQTAVDYAGPFSTIQGRKNSRTKRWLCLFTCLSTRAVHLEVAFGLDTDSFLNAFMRFVYRRGVPKEVLSDNGTNFVGAANELAEAVKNLNQDKIRQVTCMDGIVWHFNPPAAPHFGGVFEVMIKAAKRAIYAVLKNKDVTDEQLITVFTGVESFLNSRPLTYQTADPKDNTPLTPNHFLYGQMGGRFAVELDGTVYNPQKKWRKVQEIISCVWRRWLKEYLPTLNTRSKWVEITKDLKTDDIVLVLDSNLPRGRWPLGRILETFPGKDGHNRVAKVQCGEKTFVRPIHKLVPLDV